MSVKLIGNGLLSGRQRIFISGNALVGIKAGEKRATKRATKRIARDVTREADAIGFRPFQARRSGVGISIEGERLSAELVSKDPYDVRLSGPCGVRKMMAGGGA
jgi:hypothetical protein